MTCSEKQTTPPVESSPSRSCAEIIIMADSDASPCPMWNLLDDFVVEHNSGSSAGGAVLRVSSCWTVKSENWPVRIRLPHCALLHRQKITRFSCRSGASMTCLAALPFSLCPCYSLCTTVYTCTAPLHPSRTINAEQRGMRQTRVRL